MINIEGFEYPIVSADIILLVQTVDCINLKNVNTNCRLNLTLQVNCSFNLNILILHRLRFINNVKISKTSQKTFGNRQKSHTILNKIPINPLLKST